MIALHDVHVSFGARPLLRGLTLQARDGRITALLGLNGAGKSTTMRAIAGLIEPHRGHIALDGHAVRGGDLPPTALAIVPDQFALSPRLTVREQVAFYGRLRGLAPALIVERTEHLLDALRLGSLASSRCAGLSLGETMKVALARALVSGARNLLLDEPTRGLDVLALRELRGMLRALRDGGMAVLLTTHVIDEVRSLADDVAVLHDGRVVATESVAELAARDEDNSLEEAFVRLVTAPTSTS